MSYGKHTCNTWSEDLIKSDILYTNEREEFKKMFGGELWRMIPSGLMLSYRRGGKAEEEDDEDEDDGTELPEEDDEETDIDSNWPEEDDEETYRVLLEYDELLSILRESLATGKDLLFDKVKDNRFVHLPGVLY